MTYTYKGKSKYLLLAEKALALGDQFSSFCNNRKYSY